MAELIDSLVAGHLRPGRSDKVLHRKPFPLQSSGASSSGSCSEEAGTEYLFFAAMPSVHLQQFRRS
jgi:hypothetical protein